MVYDYEFSSDIDVILKGYYPVAASLWIQEGFKSAPYISAILPLQLFPSNAGDCAHSR